MFRVELRARLTGEDKLYRTEFEFPEFSNEHPELERLWALDRIDEIELDKIHSGGRTTDRAPPSR